MCRGADLIPLKLFPTQCAWALVKDHHFPTPCKPGSALPQAQIWQKSAWRTWPINLDLNQYQSLNIPTAPPPPAQQQPALGKWWSRDCGRGSTPATFSIIIKIWVGIIWVIILKKDKEIKYPLTKYLCEPESCPVEFKPPNLEQGNQISDHGSPWDVLGGKGHFLMIESVLLYPGGLESTM